MKKHSFLILFSALTIFSLMISSCSKEERITLPKTTVFTNQTIDISFDRDGSNLNFYIDAIDDFTNAIDGTWPDLDLYRIYFDKNNNGIVDEGIDFLISPTEAGICYATLIDQRSNSACSFIEDLTGTSNFGTTDNQSEEHVYYQVTVPISLLSSTSKVNFFVYVRDSESGWSYYPVTRNPVFFEETFEISW